MSLTIKTRSKPDGLMVKTFGFDLMDNTVHLGDYEISLEDFLVIAEYVLTNTDLEHNDPRIQFVKCIQSMKQTDGYNPGRKRLEASEPAVLPPQSYRLALLGPIHEILLAHAIRIFLFY